MSTRRNDIRPHGVDKDAPHQVEIVASICQGRNYDAVFGFAQRLGSLNDRHGSTRRNDTDYLRIAFKQPEDADAFQRRFGGVRITALKKSGRWVYEPVAD
jgi:hypothetical protein